MMLALALCVGLVAAGCSMEGAKGVYGSGPDAVIRVYATEPQNGLVPTDTTEQMGGRVLDALFTGLYEYAADGTQRLANAESVETKDNKHFVVTLKPDWTFSDGTPVRAQNYVRAWNFGAAVGNLQKQQAFFEPIDGYDEVAAEGATVTEMRGLTVIDDRTFTIDLTQPNIDFKLGLGHTPFVPLPDVFFTQGPERFGQHPIGNGRYVFKQWRHNVQIDVVRNDAYRGPKPMNGGLTFVLYANADTAYADLQSGNLDVLELVPNSALRSIDRVMGDHVMRRTTAQNIAIALPFYIDHFANDEEGRLRRRAISMAIDRPQIIDKVLFGSRSPALDFTARTIPGWDGALPGNEVLGFHPEEARKLWARADAIRPWSGSFQLAYNTDGDHQQWVDAVTNQIKNTLDITAHGKPYATFKQIRTEVTDKALTTAARTGWAGDYPSLLNFLTPQFVTGAGSNDAQYRNPEFDAKLREAQRATDVAAANRLANEAQQHLLRDLPLIPLWDYKAIGATGDGVRSEITWKGDPDYPNTTKE